jgi:4-amino-4-deoxy-L-arabinose transferase-like glycosyltransferase
VQKTLIKYHLFFLAGIWCIVQIVAWLRFGIVLKGESQKYILEAEYFWQHYKFSEPKYIFYSVYITIQLIFNKTGLGFTGIYLFQLALNLFSIYSFNKLCNQVFSNRIIAFASTLLLILCYPWQSWTTHLYTESVFLSLVMIFTYLFLKPSKSKTEQWWTWLLLLLVLLARPTGMLIIPIAGAHYLARFVQERKWLSFSVFGLGCIVALAQLLNYAMRGEGEFDFMKPFVEEHIICGVATNSNSHPILPANGNSVQGLLEYIVRNPNHFTELAFKKLRAFFGMTREYYSGGHNMYLVLFFYPLYLLGIFGVFDKTRQRWLIIQYCLGMILIFSISVALTCDDWLNRFIMPIVPFIILMAAMGIEKLGRLTFNKSERNS